MTLLGLKSLAVAALAGVVAIGALRGDAFARFEHLSTASAFAIGLFAASGGGLLAWGVRPEVAGIGLAIGGSRRLAIVTEPARGTVRELPPAITRALLVGMFACIGLATFTNEATARIAALPAELGEPSRAGYCLEKPPAATAPAAEPEPEPEPVDQAGCALVKRAFELGYAKSLGTCAPRPARVVRKAAPVAEPADEPCEQRQLDEPFGHYAWRKLEETTEDVSPAASVGQRIEALGVRVDYTRDLLADIRHSVTGTPHASHHLWLGLPDPHPAGVLASLLGHEPCTSRFGPAPLWPAWTTETEPSAVVEHVLGQLLFATRFGTPASCSDYTLHWDAPADACHQLAADPEAFLARAGALSAIRGVLDRRRRQLAIRELAARLGEESTIAPPPPASAVISVGCLVIDRDAPIETATVALDGEPIAVRTVHVAAIRPTGTGPLAVFRALAQLLGGRPYAGAARQTGVLAEPPLPAGAATALPLLALEPFADIDPFLEPGRVPLDRAELVEVYPFEHHLFAFVDAFRRVYLPQRGRL